MKSGKPTTYLTAAELKQMASLKHLDAESGPSGPRRNALLEEATAIDDLIKVRLRRVR